MKIEKLTFDAYRDGGTALVFATRTNEAAPGGELVCYFVHGTCRGVERTDVTISATTTDLTPILPDAAVQPDEIKVLLEAVLAYDPAKDFHKDIFNSYAFHYRIVRSLLAASGLVAATNHR